MMRLLTNILEINYTEMIVPEEIKVTDLIQER